MSSSNRAGFTLIEMAIGMTIIGLVVGAIFAGTALMSHAEMRRVISEQANLQTAIRTFIAKYDCLPGDCPNAQSKYGLGYIWILISDGNGDGDGWIRWDGQDLTRPWSAIPQIETGEFWLHLMNSGIITDVYGSVLSGNTTYAQMSKIANASWMAGHGSIDGFSNRLINKNYLIFSRVNNSFAPVTGCGGYVCGALTPYRAFMIDEKIDNGKPHSGMLLAVGSFTHFGAFYNDPAMTPSAGAAGSANCEITGNTEYNKSNTTDPACALAFEFQNK